MNAVLPGFTVWSEVSMMTVNPVPVLSPTHRTSKLSVFIHLSFFFIVSKNIKYHVSIMYHVCVLFSKTYLCQFLLFYLCKGLKSIQILIICSLDIFFLWYL